MDDQSDQEDLAGLILDDVDRRLQLIEEVTLPESARGTALLFLQPNIEGVMAFSEDELRLVHALMADGYEWARSSHFTLGKPRSNDLTELLDDLATGDEENLGVSLATVTSVLQGESFIFGGQEPGGPNDGEDFMDVVTQKLTLAGVKPEDPHSPGMVDAFVIGAMVCAAEKQMVLAIDRNRRKPVVKSQRRRKWLRKQ